MTRGPAKTNAARLLDDLGLPYAMMAADIPDDDLSAETAAKLLGLPEEMVYKTLLLRGDKTGLLEAMVPASGDVDLKALAALSGNKRVSMAPLKELLPLTGYQRGGCSPLGGKHDYPVFVSENVLLLDEVLFNAGKRGLFLIMKPDDLIKAAKAAAGPIELAKGP